MEESKTAEITITIEVFKDQLITTVKPENTQRLHVISIIRSIYEDFERNLLIEQAVKATLEVIRRENEKKIIDPKYLDLNQILENSKKKFGSK